MNGQINSIRRLNRHIRGWGFVQVIGASDRGLVRVRDCETGIEYPAAKSDLRRLTVRQTKEYLNSVS